MKIEKLTKDVFRVAISGKWQQSMKLLLLILRIVNLQVAKEQKKSFWIFHKFLLIGNPIHQS